MKKSEKNLTVIQNFILHLTHSGEHGMDAHYKTHITLTPKIMYQAALDYVNEDHVDGEGNPEDHIVTYGAEVTFGDVDVVADFGPEVGTQTAVTITGKDNLGAVEDLLDFIKNPYGKMM
tara:strand:+ start:1247 stop:1603 length:357 start_codon:yes stop_codon:yes gene_type:complete